MIFDSHLVPEINEIPLGTVSDKIGGNPISALKDDSGGIIFVVNDGESQKKDIVLSRRRNNLSILK
ncbi:MAG: hypothetical protein D6B27_09805 [Gammaproteobacteria bacterium]|nr:MAG: hypothetical protein D6B27_09805 [Gammaproteobacteria bacterium]